VDAPQRQLLPQLASCPALFLTTPAAAPRRRLRRAQKRQEVLERRRKVSAPVVVAILPLSPEVDTDRLYSGLLAACETFGQQQQKGGPGGDMDMGGRRRLATGLAALASTCAGRAGLRVPWTTHSRAASHEHATRTRRQPSLRPLRCSLSSSSARSQRPTTQRPTAQRPRPRPRAEDLPPAAPLGLQTVAVQGRSKLRVTLVPPAADLEDLLQVGRAGLGCCMAGWAGLLYGWLGWAGLLYGWLAGWLAVQQHPLRVGPCVPAAGSAERAPAAQWLCCSPLLAAAPPRRWRSSPAAQSCCCWRCRAARGRRWWTPRVPRRWPCSARWACPPSWAWCRTRQVRGVPLPAAGLRCGCTNHPGPQGSQGTSEAPGAHARPRLPFPRAGSGALSMKERSASKKRAEKGLTAHLPGDHRLFHADTADDCSQLVGAWRAVLAAVPLQLRAARGSGLEEGASAQRGAAVMLKQPNTLIYY
jgi:hypothetical protein